MRLLIAWIINALALFALPYVFTGIHVTNFVSALIAALVLAIINTIIRPILVLLTLPVTILTLGLFIFIINGLIFLGVANLVQGFQVLSFWHAVGASILFSILAWILSAIVQR